jgi:thiol-disulfide isomerase/thioredoxin
MDASGTTAAPARGGAARRRGVRGAVLLLVALLVPAVAVLALPSSPATADQGEIELLSFGTSTCPFCVRMDAHLATLERAAGGRLEVVRFDVATDPEGRARWEQELAARGMRASGVPTVILGELVWIGFDDRIAREIAQAVESALADAAAAAGSDAGARGDPTTLRVPLFGDVVLAERSAVGVTALIAFVDGFNPCSLWVLTVLLAMVINAGATRGRILAVGATFLTVTTLVYGLFIVGVFNVLGLIERIGTIRLVVAAVAITVGAVNLKDFFAFGRGLSFSIPDRAKPRIYRGGRAMRDIDRRLPAVLATTVVLALGIALVELPCTAGFPVIWTGTMRTLGVEGGAEFWALLALYLAVYLLDELLVFGVVVVTLRLTRFEERHGRVLKLVGGSVMVALGVAMVAAPELLDDLGGLLVLTGGAVALALLLVGVERLRRRSSRTGASRTGASRTGTR